VTGVQTCALPISFTVSFFISSVFLLKTDKSKLSLILSDEQ